MMPPGASTYHRDHLGSYHQDLPESYDHDVLGSLRQMQVEQTDFNRILLQRMTTMQETIRELNDLIRSGVADHAQRSSIEAGEVSRSISQVDHHAGMATPEEDAGVVDLCVSGLSLVLLAGFFRADSSEDLVD